MIMLMVSKKLLIGLTLVLATGCGSKGTDAPARHAVNDTQLRQIPDSSKSPTTPASGDPGPNGMTFTLIRSKNVTFQMGSPESEVKRYADEKLHAVTFTHDYEIQTTDVTQDQWVKVMGSNPSNYKAQMDCPNHYRADFGGICPNTPVDKVNWNDTQVFIKKLNEHAQGCSYRLPTEAEWEYAARAGSTTAYYVGKDTTVLHDYEWFFPAPGIRSNPEVGQKKPNPFGLYDMTGNVAQWVNDWYAQYSDRATIDPTGPNSGSFRVVRGATRDDWLEFLRSAKRGSDLPDERNPYVSFRLVRICK